MTKEEDALRSKVCSAVARLLREERERQMLSMSEVAGRAGISQQMVSYVERGMRVPTIDTLFRLAQAMGLSPVSLLAKAAAPDLGLRSRYRRRTGARGRD
jgi:transcriptional regulator with XRE-family HTH domain